MKKFIAALFAVIGLTFAGVGAAQAYPILTPDYPSVYWDETCDIHGTRPADVVNDGNIGNITYTEEDGVYNSSTGQYEWIVYAHLDDSATSWAQPLPDGWTFTDGSGARTIEVHYLDYYCG